MENSAVDDDRSTFIDGENRSKRLSILKPPKSRPPLKDVNFGESIDDTEDFETARRRRVSFAGVNSIKEFCSNAESLQVCHVQSYEETFSTSSDNSNNSCGGKVVSSNNEPTGSDCNFVDDPMDLTDSDAHVLELKTDSDPILAAVPLLSQMKQSLPVMENAVTTDAHPTRKSGLIAVEMFSQCSKTSIKYSDNSVCTNITTKSTEQTESKFHIAVPTELVSMDTTEPLGWIQSSTNPNHGEIITNFHSVGRGSSIANFSDSEMEFTQALPQKIKNLPTRLSGEDMNNTSMEITEPVDNPFKLVQSRRSSANERNMEDNERKVNLLAYQNMSKTETSFSNGMELTEPIAKYPPIDDFPTQNVIESNLNNSTTQRSELIYQKGKSWNEKVGSSIGTSKDMEMTGVLSLSKCEQLLSKTKMTDDMEFTEILPTINDKNSGEETGCIQTLREEASKCQAIDGNDCPPVCSQAKEDIQEPETETVDHYIPRIEFGNNRKPCSPVELSFLKEFNASCDTSKISGDTEDYSGSIHEIVPVKSENSEYNAFKELGRKSMKMFGESEIGELRCINRSSQSDESVSAVIPRNPASFNVLVNRDVENSVTSLMQPDKSLHDSFILKGAPELTCTEEVPRVCYDFTEPLSSVKDSIAQQNERDKLQFSTQISNPVTSETLGLASMDKTNIPQSRTVLDCEDMDTSITNGLYSNVPQFPISNATNLCTSGNMELTEVLPTQHKICFPIPPVSSEEIRMNNTCEIKTSDQLLDNMDISMDETLMKGNTPIVRNSAKINPKSSDGENVLQGLRNDKNNETCDTPKSSNLDRYSNIDLEMEHTAIAETHPSHARRSLTFSQDQEKVHDFEPNQKEECSPRLTQNDSNAFHDQPTNSAIHNEDYASQNTRSPLSSITQGRKSVFNGDNANSDNMYSNDTHYLSSKDNDFAQEENGAHTFGCKKSIPVISSEMSPRDILQANDQVLDDTLITMRKSVAAKDQSSGCFIPSFTFPETQVETAKNIQSHEVGHNDNETESLMDISSVSTNSVPISSEFVDQKDEKSKFISSTVNCDGDLLHHSHSESVEENNIHLQSVAIESNDAQESELCTELEMNSEAVANSKSFGIRGSTRPSLIPVRSDVPDPYVSTLQRKSCVGITSATYSLEEETVEAAPSGGLINEHPCQGSRKSCTGSIPNSELSPEIPKTSLREPCIGFDTVADDTGKLESVNRKPRKSIFLQQDVSDDKPPVELCTSQETCQNAIFKTSGRKSCVGVDLTSNDNIFCEATNSNIMPEAEQSKPRKSVFQPAVEDILENEIVGTTPVIGALNEHTLQETLSTRKSCVGSGVNSNSSSNVLTISGRKSCVGNELTSNDQFLGAVESGNIMNEAESPKTRSSICLGASQDALREENDVETTRKSCIGSAVSSNPSTAIKTSERKSVGNPLTNGVDSNSTKDDSFPIQTRAPRKSAFLGPFVNELDIDPLVSEPSLPDGMPCHGLPEQTYDTKPSTKTSAEDFPNDHEDLMNISNDVDDTDDRMHISSTPLKLNDTGLSACSRKRSHSRRKSLRPVISCEDLANELSQDLMNVSLQSETKSPLPKKMSIEIVEVPDVVASRVINSINIFGKNEGMGESTVSFFDGLSYETRVKNSNLLKSFAFRSMGRRTWKTTFINETFGVIIILPACQFTEHTQIESVRYSFHPEKIGKTCLLDIDIVKFLKCKITEEYSEYWLKQNCTRIGDLRAVVDRLNSEINFLRPTAEKLILMKLIHPCKINRNQLSFTIISAKEIRKFEVTIDINFNRTVDSYVFVTNLVGEVDESCVQLVFRSISPDKDMFHKFVDKLYEMLPRLCV